MSKRCQKASYFFYLWHFFCRHVMCHLGTINIDSDSIYLFLPLPVNDNIINISYYRPFIDIPYRYLILFITRPIRAKLAFLNVFDVNPQKADLAPHPIPFPSSSAHLKILSQIYVGFQFFLLLSAPESERASEQRPWDLFCSYFFPAVFAFLAACLDCREKTWGI